MLESYITPGALLFLTLVERDISLYVVNFHSMVSLAVSYLFRVLQDLVVGLNVYSGHHKHCIVPLSHWRRNQGGHGPLTIASCRSLVPPIIIKALTKANHLSTPPLPYANPGSMNTETLRRFE